jgi:hypothetical protein
VYHPASEGLCDATATSSSTLCTFLDCLDLLIGRKGDDECYTIADFQGAPPTGVDPDAWSACYNSFLTLLDLWASIGEAVSTRRCLDLPYDDLLNINDGKLVVQYQTIYLPAGSVLQSTRCYTVGTECDTCP